MRALPVLLLSLALLMRTATLQAQSAGATAAPAISGGGQGTPYTLESSAKLVVLDVVVTDKAGRVPAGLTRDDFKVTENGVPQRVVNVDGPGAHVPAADAHIGSTADLMRVAPLAPVNILVIDEYNTLFKDIAYARYSLKRYLETQPEKLPSPTQLLAVSLFKYDVVVDDTDDRAKLLAGLEHLPPVYPVQAETSGWQVERYKRTFEALEKVAAANAGIPGHKNVIWVGGGFARLSSLVGGDTRTDLEDAVRKCTNLLRDSRITLYDVNPAGNPFTQYKTTAGPGTDLSLDTVDPFGGSLDFAKMSDETGGKVLIGRNDVDTEIGTAIRDGASLYTVSYRPSDENAAAGKFRHIRVTLVPHDLVAKTRGGYYPEDGTKKLIGNLMLTLRSNAVFDGVPVKVTAAAGGVFRVNLSPNEGSWVADSEGSPKHIDLLVLCATFDEDGKKLDESVKTFRVTQAASGATHTAVDVKLPVGGKAVRARFVLRVEQTGQVGTADVALVGNAKEALR